MHIILNLVIYEIYMELPVIRLGKYIKKISWYIMCACLEDPGQADAGFCLIINTNDEIPNTLMDFRRSQTLLSEIFLYFYPMTIQ